MRAIYSISKTNAARICSRREVLHNSSSALLAFIFCRARDLEALDQAPLFVPLSEARFLVAVEPGRIAFQILLML